MVKNKVKSIALTLAVVSTLTLAQPVFNVKADSFITVSMANDITDEQKQQVYETFGISKDSVQEILVTNADEREALLGIVPEEQIGSATISCAYVEPLAKGNGIQITTNNLSWVTTSMLQNALITAGITDAKVIATAPFPVSGTGALTGILKAFESNDDITISEEQKEAANEELVATGQIGEEIGQDEAAIIVNEVKAQVIKDSPKTDIEIGQIINNVTNNYNITLSEEDKAKLTSVMRKVNDLDYDYSDLKETLAQTTDNFMSNLDEATTKLKESGVPQKVWLKTKSVFAWIGEGLSNLGTWLKYTFSDEEFVIEKDGIKYNKDGEMIQEGNLYIEGETRTPEEIKSESLENKTEVGAD